MTEMNPVVNKLFTIAETADWEKFNDDLVRELGDVDGDIVAATLLERASDPNPDFRDVVASSLTALNIKDREIFSRAVCEMINMAENDEERFPAGRAVMFLLAHKDDETLGEEICKGIEKFKTRSEISEWKNDLKESIPGIEELLN